MNEFAEIARWLILPPHSLFLLLALGFLLSGWLPRVSRALGAVAVLLLYLLSTPVVANLMVDPLERFHPPLATARGTGAGAIVVLAAGRVANAPEYGDRDIPDYIALARLRYAAKLYRETGLPVLVSGGGGQRREPYAVGMARALREEFGIPVQWLEDKSSTTAENARFSASILKQHRIGRVLLVTDAMHMQRAVLSFRQTELEVVPAPTVFFGFEYTDVSPMHFLPSAEGLRRSYYALYQWLGIAWYELHYQMAALDGMEKYRLKDLFAQVLFRVRPPLQPPDNRVGSLYRSSS
jgi:uncharacterized SAM-binding protein YcdF (DUF218 family)